MRVRDVPVKFADLFDAFQLYGSDSEGGLRVHVCRQSGRIYWPSDEKVTGVAPDALPDDVDDEDKYFTLPGKKELGLGKPLVLDFAQEFLPGAFDDVRDMFNRRGAFARFRALLTRKGLRDQWHAFEASAEERALREWCKDMKITMSE